MLRCCCTVLLLTFGCATARAQQDQLYTATREQLDVTKALLHQEEAWNKGDLEAYVAFYKDAPDTVAMLATPVRGLEAIRSAFRVNFPNAAAMGTLEESSVEVRMMGENFGLATGKYHIVRGKKSGGDVEGVFTEIFEKTKEGWRVIFSQTT